jgi:hypothetical protein
MLRIYDDMLDALKLMRTMVTAIDRLPISRDSCGALPAAWRSTSLKGAARAAGCAARYRTALGSARETMACLQVAEAYGYVEAVPRALLDAMNRVVGTLVTVAV